MRLQVISWLVVITLSLSIEALRGQGTAEDEPPLRLSEPLKDVVRDLESYVPRFMSQESIPGVSIALVRDAEVVWIGSFGATNTITGEPVTEDTLFEVASNSKVMTAYMALRLVDEGKLSLDRPLNDYLSEPWLPPSRYREMITLRHVLSHSSGLGHNSPSRESLFGPGEGYSYSGLGYLYLQEVIEEVTEKNLEHLAEQLLFTPLQMSSSSYVNEDSELTARTANGHVWAAVPVLFFVFLLLIALLCLSLIGLPIQRCRSGSWWPTPRGLLGAFFLAFLLSLLVPLFGFGWLGLSKFAWSIIYSGIGLTVAVSLFLYAGRSVILKSTGRPGWRYVAMVGWMFVLLTGLAFAVTSIRNLPVPSWPEVPARGESSVRATVGDLASFLLEISDPKLLSLETAQELRTSQVFLDENLSWGLGPGIQHSRQGDALWQWGQNIDFQSAMIIYPDLGFGVVVLTNSDLLNPDVAIHIAHRAIGGKIEPIIRASHTEFNYR